MQPTVLNNFDPAFLLSGSGAKRPKGKGPVDDTFDMLFDQLAGGGQGGLLAGLGQSGPAAVPPSGTGYQDAYGGRPIDRLEQSLRSTGRPLEEFQVAAADRDKLEKVLVKSGYREEDAQEMLKRASNSDGSVNLGTLYGIMSEYPADQGPVFLLNAEDEPLLAQTLKELGVPADKVRDFLQGLPRQGGKIVVRGLPELLSQAQAGPDGFMVDRELLADLLGRLGLNQDEVQGLLNQAVGQNGRTDPQAMLALFTAAADKQNLALTDVLRELAGRMQINPVPNQAAQNPAAQIRAQVMKKLSFQQGQTLDVKELFRGALAQARQAGLPGADSQGSQAEVPGMQGLALAAARGKGAGGGKGQGSGQEPGSQSEPGPKAELNLQRAGQARAVEQQTATRTGESAQVAQRRGPLPSYLVRQVADQMVQMTQKQQSSLRLQLKPPSLGELSLELSVKHGAVRATLMTDTVAAKNALDAGLEQLKQLLGQQGLRLERLEVLVNPDSQQRQAHLGGQGGGSRRRRGGRRQDEELMVGGGVPGRTENPISAWAALGGDGRINLFA